MGFAACVASRGGCMLDPAETRAEGGLVRGRGKRGVAEEDRVMWGVGGREDGGDDREGGG